MCIKAFDKMGLHPLMLNALISALECFNNDLVTILGIIHLAIKLRNDDDDYLKSRKTSMLWTITQDITQ